MRALLMTAKKKGGWQPGANTIAYYPFNGDANDYSGNNRNLTTNGVTYTETIANGNRCGTFTGTIRNNGSKGGEWTSGVSMSNANMTLSVRAKTTGNGTDSTFGTNKWILLYFQDSGRNYGQNIKTAHLTTGYKALEWGVGSNDIGTSPETPTPYADGQWHHICATYTMSSVKLFVDGQLVASGTGNITAVTTNYNIYVGKDTTSYNYYGFAGQLSEVILEDKTRTAQEVSDYYNLTKDNYKWQPLNPICWYKFDGDYTDSTGNFGVASGTSSFQTLSSGVQVLQTDGTNLVSLPSGITANSISTYTIAFWMKPITTNPTYGYYAGCGYADSTHISFYENTSGRDFVEWYGGNRDLTTSGVGAGWRMICFRSNGSTCDLVVNGNNKTATTTAPSIFGYSTDNIFVLGARTPNVPAVTGQRTSVQISNFVISNSYWDDAELMKMYNATKDNYPQNRNSNNVEENYIKIEPTEDIHITPSENDNGSGDLQKF